MSFGFGFGFTKITAAIRAAFSPSSLFAANEPGVWFDPSDLSTLFQDAAGTTSVTAVEQPVGLMLDKSKGLVLGPELATNGTFDTDSGWTKTGSATISSGACQLGNGSAGAVYQAITFVPGKSYRVTITVAYTTGRCEIDTTTSGGTRVDYLSLPQTTGTTTFLFTAQGSAARLRISTRDSSVPVVSIDNISVRELPGNHAYQTTATSRPVLSARYNLLTKTEQFDDAVWAKINATTVGGDTDAPNGLQTSNAIIETSAAGNHYITYNINSTYGTTTEISCYAKTIPGSATNFLQIILPYNSLGGKTDASRIACFDLTEGTVAFSAIEMQASITDAGGGWWRCKVTKTPVQPTYVGKPIFALSKVSSTAFQSYTGDGTSGIYIWGASLVPANQAHLPYQRVNTATDYDTAGFPHYLRFDGVDDGMVTNTITPGIDKAQVFAGVRKLSDAVSVIADLGPGNTTGSLVTYVQNPTGYGFNSVGTSTAAAQASTGYGSPIINVLTGLGDISGDFVTLRINGTQAANNTLDQGTGNFLTYPLYIGRRGGTTFPFNGHLYSLIVRFGPNLPAATIENTEKYINTKTGAY